MHVLVSVLVFVFIFALLAVPFYYICKWHKTLKPKSEEVFFIDRLKERRTFEWDRKPTPKAPQYLNKSMKH